MDSKTFDQIQDAINDRSSWETKMSSYYDMRFEGIRRAFKPYKNAPDVHYALVDTVIEKLKPFYAQQLYADQVIATFIAQDPVPRDMVTLVEQWFDYKIKQCSNFERAIMNGIDMMLHYGFCPFKIYWDEVKNDLGFEAVDPMYIIVPKNTDVDCDPDWLVHVKIMSRAQYMADKTYKNKAKDFVDQIVGRGSNPSGTTVQKEQSQAQREGLNFSTDRNRIVVWESFTKTDKGWQVDTIAPVKGYDTPLRATFMLASEYLSAPFVCLRNESTTKGWYSPRGITEILFTHEMSLNKSWNTKLQFLDFFGHPVYKNSGLAPINSESFKASPGRILPQGVEPVTPTSAPIDFNEEMQFVRALAEDRIQIPDLSAGEHLSGRKGQKGEVTATQVNAVVALSNQSNDLRARLFRMQLADIYNQAWSILKKRAAKDSSFVAEGQYLSMPLDLKELSYSIHPSGSADSWNKAYRVQDATMTYQMLFGKPNVNQDELLKYLLEAKDPRLTKKLYQDTGFGNQLQAEKQANELLLMDNGYPPVVKPDDNDAIHLQEIPQWTQMKMAKGQHIEPGTAKLVMDHITQHGQQAAKKQDKAGMMAMRQIGPTTNILQAIMAQGGIQTPEAGMNGQAGMQGGAGSGTIPSQSINYKDAPDSIKRQMEVREGYQPAIGQTTPNQEKLMTDVATKTHATIASQQNRAGGGTEGGAATSPSPPPPPPPQFHVHIPNSITHHIPAPIVNVPAPVVNIPPHPPQQAPIVHVPAPIVNVHPTPVHIHPAPLNMPGNREPAQLPAKKSGKRRVTVVRDSSGKITGAETEEE